MGCGGSRAGGASLTGSTITPYRGVSFQGSGFLTADVEIRDRKDPDARRAKLMERQKREAKLHRSQSWTAPGATTALDREKGMTPQQLRDRAAKRDSGAGQGLSKSWSAGAPADASPVRLNHRARQEPQRHRKQRGVLALDLPVDNCDGSFGNFWGTSPHSPQDRHTLEQEEQMKLAHVGAAYAPLRPVGMMNDKKKQKQIAAKKGGSNLRSDVLGREKKGVKKQPSEAEKKARKKERRLKEQAFMSNMLDHEGEDETAAAGDGEEESEGVAAQLPHPRTSLDVKTKEAGRTT